MPDVDVKHWQTPAAIRARDKIVVGLLQESEFASLIPRIAPNIEIVLLDRPRAYLDGERPDVDAVLGGAEALSFWTMPYPRFRVVRPQGMDAAIPLVIPYAGEDERLRALLDHWVALAANNDTLEPYYDHWMLGKTAVVKQPRWSIIRNVFGWVD